MISGLLIASGLSSRIKGFKPLLSYNEKSFLIIILEKILSVTTNIVIVVGHNHSLILEELEKHFNDKAHEIKKGIWQITKNIEIVYNNNYQKGMFTSLKIGIEQLKDSDWILYHFVDQPSIPQKFYNEFISLINSNVNWIQPTNVERAGHPILFDKYIILKVNDSDNSSNLRLITQGKTIKKQFWNCNYSQILEDIDTNEDYEKLLSNEIR